MSQDQTAEANRLQELIRQHAAQLAEHFDNVQIFCNGVTDDGGRFTRSHDHGIGNFHARAGQVIEWYQYHATQNRAKATCDYAEQREEEKE